MKKILSVVLAIIFFTGVLVGCSQNTKSISAPVRNEVSSTIEDETEVNTLSDTMPIETRSGIYVGKEQDGVLVFKGIKYAEAPRFKPPVMVEESSEIFEAFEYGPTALQFPNNPTEKASYNVQSEDCLNLNIWAKNTEEIAKQKRPVMVYIHGGGCVVGGSADPLYDGGNFAKRNNVVLVTINYRLNVLGFMDLEPLGGAEYKDSKNLGILDQITALKWVKENIGAFGGDPNNVTIFGNSAGGMSASALMIAPQAKGLFNKVIAQSGTLASLKSKEAARKIGEAFIDFAGVNSVEELLSLTEEEIRNLSNEFTVGYTYASTAIYLPTADGQVIPEDPYGAISDGAASDIKLMIGSTLDELNYWKLYYENFNNSALDFLMCQIEANDQKVSKTSVWLLSKAFRLLDLKASAEKRNQALVNDLIFRMPSIKIAELQSKHNDVWMYLFEHPSTIEGLDACHTIELNFVFNVLDADVGHAGGNQPKKLADQTQDAWAAFATNGDPSHKNIPHWPKYNVETRQTMLINEEWIVETDPNKKDREFLQVIVK